MARTGSWETKTLYSLEKLIEWKRLGGQLIAAECQPLYSLEKLIEWKLQNDSRFLWQS